MFSDTHFHFELMNDGYGVNGVDVLLNMAKKNCFFAMDIGTKCDDLLSRQSCVEKTIAQIDAKYADKCRSFIHFSAGIWPGIDDINDRSKGMDVLSSMIEKTSCDAESDTLNRKIIAIGECGIDHHWNPSGADGRTETDFTKETYFGERELFEMQLLLAKKMNLPIIVHSRDAFEDTLDCIKNSDYDNGIIHCFSYGYEEAKAFLERGWYISLSGGVTYAKKSKIDDMKRLLQSIPSERILLETDSPYLAPTPLRGNTNNPTFIEHTYDFVAKMRETSVESLCDLVDSNVKKLFRL